MFLFLGTNFILKLYYLKSIIFKKLEGVCKIHKYQKMNTEKNQSILQILFTYVDSLTNRGVPLFTGYSAIYRKDLLKCFFLKAIFQMDA